MSFCCLSLSGVISCNCMELLTKISEQSTRHFTGKINVLKADSNQFLAAIHLLEGRVVGATYKDRLGENAVFSVFCDGLADNHNYVIEPEKVDYKFSNISLTAIEIQKKLKNIFTDLPVLKKLIPPSHLKLIIDSKFIIEGAPIGVNEFRLLATITDYAKVSDIYNYSPFVITDTTRLLINLRKLKALKVVQS